MEEKIPISVGYAFREKRIKSLFTQALFERGLEESITFTRIDPSVPLVSQGKFDVVLHKFDGESWAQQLSDYLEKYPETVILDNYERVHLLDDRLQMLEVVSHLDSSQYGAAIESPRQLNIPIGTEPSEIINLVEEAGLKLPFVSKPTAANGTTNAHQLALVITREALATVEPPVVLQEFVNHGGVLFKLYVLGDKVMVFKRQSLPDIPSEYVDQEADKQQNLTPEKDHLEADAGIPSASEALNESESIGALIKQGAGLVEFNRISNVHLSEEEMAGKVVDPPAALMEKLGLELRDRLGVSAFNVDILREEGRKDRYFIVDINYMPGYERLPDFESMFLDFLRNAAMAVKKVGSVSDAESAEEGKGLVTPYPVLAKKKWQTVKAAFKLVSLGGRGLHR